MLALSQDPLLTPLLPALLLQLVPEIEANDIVILRASIFFWSHQTWPSPLNQSVLRQSYTNTCQMRELIACHRPRTLRTSPGSSSFWGGGHGRPLDSNH